MPTILSDFCASMVLLMATPVRKYSPCRLTSICCTDGAGGGAATNMPRRIDEYIVFGWRRVFTKYRNFAAMLRTKSSLVLNLVFLCAHIHFAFSLSELCFKYPPYFSYQNVLIHT